MPKPLVSVVWDDALVTDLRLIEIIRKIGVTSSFAISPRRHGNARKPNDFRDSRFGKIVSSHELKEFADFEILNHTANHKELTKIDPESVLSEVSDGKKALQDLFGRDIPGFCYPYGSYDQRVAEVVKICGHLYARTSRIVGGPVSFGDVFGIGTSARWFNLHDVHLKNGPFIFWGHSYEVSDWTLLEHFYDSLKNNAKIVAFKDLLGVHLWKKL